MRFTLSLNVFAKHNQATNKVTDQGVRELSQDELARLHGGHGKDCHHNHHHHCDHSCHNSCNYYCNSYCNSSYYCYTY